MIRLEKFYDLISRNATVTLTNRQLDTTFFEGSLRVHGSIFHYWFKQYDEGSEFGIDGGRISKLMLKRNGEIVCNYDRGWDVQPVDEDTQLAYEILVHTENF